MSVAGSDKHGGAVSGSHVSEKEELVPIKKRRFLYRSCSPPRISSPPKEKTPRPSEEQDHQDRPVIVLSAPSVPKLDNGSHLQIDTCHKSFNIVNESLEQNDDCLSLLADAACSTSLPMDMDNPEHDSGMMRSKVVEGQYEDFTANCKMESLCNEMIKGNLQVSSKIGTDSSPVAAIPIQEDPSISVPDKRSEAGRTIKDTSCAAYSNTLSYEEGEAVGSQRQQSPDDRLHWDLNVVMDVWEQPFDCSDAQTSDLKLGDTINDDKSMKTTGNSDRIVKPEVSSLINRKRSLSEPERPVDQGLRHNSDDCGAAGDEKKQPLDICQISLKMPSICEKNVPLDHKHDLNDEHVAHSLNLDGAPSDSTDLKFELHETCSVATENTSFVKNVGRFSYNDADISPKGVGETSTDRCHIKAELVAKSLNSVTIPSDSTDLKFLSDHVSHKSCFVKAEVITFADNAGRSPLNDAKTRSTASSHPVIPRQSLTSGISRNKCIDKNVCSEEGRVADLAFSASHGSGVHMDIAQMELTTGGKIDAVLSSEKSEVKTEVAAQSSISGVIVHPSATTSSFNLSRRVKIDNYMEFFDKRKAVDAFNQKSNIDISSEHYSTLVFESEGEKLDGYDSQYEDGELKEASGLGWEEYHTFEGEAEDVEYRPTNMDTASPYDGDCQDKVVSPLSQFDSELTTNSNWLEKEHKVFEDEGRRSMASNELLGIKRGSSATETSAGDAGERVRNLSQAGRLTDSDGTENNARSREELNRVLPSQFEGQVSSACMEGTGSRWERASGYRGRFLRRPRFYVQGQPRAGQADGCVGYSNGQRVFRRQYYPTHEQDSSDAAVAMEGKDAMVDAASHIDKPLNNDDIVVDGDLGTGLQPGSTSNEELCYTRPMGRGRFLRYDPQMGNRGGRGRGRNRVSYSDNYQTTMKYRYPPFSPSERNDSPSTGRGHTLNYLPSRERPPPMSGERSSDLKSFPKGRFEPDSYRDNYLRQGGRSPNFRSDMRMMRRSPHLQDGFVTDHARVRPSRTEHLSPPMSKRMCDRKDDPGRFRDFGKDDPGRFRDFSNNRRDNMMDMPPGRMRSRGVFDGAQNSRPDGFYRSPPTRFSEAEGSSRGWRSDENYENRRKHIDPPYSSRRGFEHDNVRRFSDDNVDDLPEPSYRNVPEFHGRGMRNIGDRMEDMPRRCQREQQFIYEQDRNFDADSKPFRFNRMDTSRNIKRGEHHRSFRPGRLDEVYESGRGNRSMENYEDRRKRHGFSNAFRSDELESTGKRFDHDVNGDTVEGAQYLQSR